MKYVIIGNSAAAIGAVEGIRKHDKDGSITVVSDEQHHTYSRPLISYLLQGITDREKMKFRNDTFYSDNNCNFIFAKAEKIDNKNRQVVLADGNTLDYDKLLVATGSSAFVPPVKGLDTVTNKCTFICLDDADKLASMINQASKVLIVGAGLIGLKCAEGIAERVSGITVIDLAPRILSAVLDDECAAAVQSHLESKGIEFKLFCGVNEFNNNTAILSDNSKIDFDVVVMAAGVRPNVSLLDGIADTERGIVINAKSETTAENIYAAGDCTQTVDVSSGDNKIMALLPNAYMQGETAGINMAGGDSEFNNAIPMNAVGFFGLHIITAGNYSGEVYEEKSGNDYKKLFYGDNKLNGYILIGDVERAGIYTSLIRERTPLDSVDFELICKKPQLMAFSKSARTAKLGGAV